MNPERELLIKVLNTYESMLALMQNIISLSAKVVKETKQKLTELEGGELDEREA